MALFGAGTSSSEIIPSGDLPARNYRLPLEGHLVLAYYVAVQAHGVDFTDQYA